MKTGQSLAIGAGICLGSLALADLVSVPISMASASDFGGIGYSPAARDGVFDQLITTYTGGPDTRGEAGLDYQVFASGWVDRNREQRSMLSAVVPARMAERTLSRATIRIVGTIRPGSAIAVGGVGHDLPLSLDLFAYAEPLGLLSSLGSGYYEYRMDVTGFVNDVEGLSTTWRFLLQQSPLPSTAFSGHPFRLSPHGSFATEQPVAPFESSFFRPMLELDYTVPAPSALPVLCLLFVRRHRRH